MDLLVWGPLGDEPSVFIFDLWRQISLNRQAPLPRWLLALFHILGGCGSLLSLKQHLELAVGRGELVEKQGCLDICFCCHPWLQNVQLIITCRGTLAISLFKSSVQEC